MFKVLKMNYMINGNEGCAEVVKYQNRNFMVDRTNFKIIHNSDQDCFSTEVNSKTRLVNVIYIVI